MPLLLFGSQLPITTASVRLALIPTVKVVLSQNSSVLSRFLLGTWEWSNVSLLCWALTTSVCFHKAMFILANFRYMGTQVHPVISIHGCLRPCSQTIGPYFRFLAVSLDWIIFYDKKVGSGQASSSAQLSQVFSAIFLALLGSSHNACCNATCHILSRPFKAAKCSPLLSFEKHNSFQGLS